MQHALPSALHCSALLLLPLQQLSWSSVHYPSHSEKVPADFRRIRIWLDLICTLLQGLEVPCTALHALQ